MQKLVFWEARLEAHPKNKVCEKGSSVLRVSATPAGALSPELGIAVW
jgi:hypothetical protein